MANVNILRVISGKFRGRNLKSPTLGNTHPMGAREKLALFNMVNVEQATVLDAYAGSGALGIEALSRGAKQAIFVENNRQAARTITNNLAQLNVDTAEVIVSKFADFAQDPQWQEHFAVVFADPPYDKINPSELQNIGKLLIPDGSLALSTPAELEPLELNNLRVSSTHTYARARITIYRKIG